MLLGKHGRRHEHSDLIAIHCRLECGTHSDLRLAEAHIAAQQTIHGLIALHITLDLGDGT